MTAKIRTIQQFVDAIYGENGSEIVNMILRKSDAPVISSTTGVHNQIYGAKAWSQLNDMSNTFNALPKKPINGGTGFRVITARAGTLGQGGVSENGAIPDSIKPTWAEAAPTLKHVAHSFDMSLLKELYEASGDDDVRWDDLRQYMALQHAKHINKMLLADADTLAGSNFESIDRVCSSQSEESALLTAGDADIYGFDRSASTAYDAYVNHNSGTDRALQTTMLRTAINTIQQNSGFRPNVIITGFDTAADIDALFETQTRYAVMRVKLGVNGVESAAGNDVGLEVSSVYGIPVIRDADVAQDTKSRIYFLNTENDHLFMGIALPTQYFEENNYLLLDRLGKRAMYLTAGELYCKNFAAQGKIRDLL